MENGIILILILTMGEMEIFNIKKIGSIITQDHFKKNLDGKFSKVSVANSTINGFEEDRTEYYNEAGTIAIILIKPIERLVIKGNK